MGSVGLALAPGEIRPLDYIAIFYKPPSACARSSAGSSSMASSSGRRALAGAERCRIDELTGLALPDSLAVNAGKFHFASGFHLVQTVRDYDVARCVAEADAPYGADAPAVATV